MNHTSSVARILLVHPCSAFCEGLGKRLCDGGHCLVGCTTDADAALSIIQSQSIHVAFIGSNENEQDRLRWCSMLHQQAPTLNLILLSSQAHDPLVQLAAFRAGAVGCLSPNYPTAAEYLEAIQLVMTGHSLFSPDVIARAQQPLDGLTSQELEVIKLMAQGKSYKQIAAELVVSAHTTRNHARNLISKLNVKDRYEATDYARKQGWVK